MIIDLFFIFFSSAATLFLIRKFAKKIGLVDKPSNRKNHNGAIPIAGGIAICISLVNILYSRPDLISNNFLLLASIIALTVIGSIDDRFDLNIVIRFLFQIIIACAFISFSTYNLDYLGDLFGFGDVRFNPITTYIMTIIAILGVINAFNMIDGLDGLLGSLSIVTFSSLAFLFKLNHQDNPAYFCLIIAVIILPYVCMNLGYLGRQRKVFMGDAGSMMLGFIAIWLLLSASQGTPESAIKPVTVLWLIGIPIMDMTATIIRRLKRGKSAFHSDQDHIHYILQHLGFSSTQSLFIICSIAGTFSFVGITGELLGTPENIMFYSFFTCFIAYSWLLSHLKKKIKIIAFQAMK